MSPAVTSPAVTSTAVTSTAVTSPAVTSPAVMSTAVLDRPATAVPELDLRGLDFATRRRLLFAALRSLPPTGELRVLSGRPEDLHWLRYEMEARLDRSYRWSPATGGTQACSGAPAGNAVVVSPRSRQR